MSGIEFDLFGKWQRELVLKKCLERVRAKGYYDYILIDSPPTLGGWVMNIMCASDYLVIPVEASPWGLFGLANMFEFCNQAKNIASNLKILGIAITKADERKKYFKQTLETLKETYPVRRRKLFHHCVNPCLIREQTANHILHTKSCLFNKPSIPCSHNLIKQKNFRLN